MYSNKVVLLLYRNIYNYTTESRYIIFITNPDLQLSHATLPIILHCSFPCLANEGRLAIVNNSVLIKINNLYIYEIKCYIYV